MRLLLSAAAIAALVAIGCDGEGAPESRQVGRDVGEAAKEMVDEVESAGKTAAREAKEFTEGVKESFDDD